MAMKKLYTTLKALLVLSWSLNAFAHGDEHGMGVVSHEYLESSIAVLKGVGTYNQLQITSSLPAGKNQELALTYTKQGIALHHAFQWEDSVRSFNEALRLDPNMSRAYTGLVTSLLNLMGPTDTFDFVQENLQKAATAAAQVQNNELDRLWVDALVVVYAAQYNITLNVAPVSQIGKTMTGDVNAKISALFGAMTNTYKDAEAYAFVGWTLGSMQFLDVGEKLFPTHSGILHYLTHVNENTGKYNEALAFGQRTIASAPDAPHLLHMVGHVLPLLGRWEEANEYFLKAHCIHKAVLRQPEPLCAGLQFEAPMSTAQPSSKEFWHFAHNLELYGFSLMRVRDLPLAEKMFSERCDAGDCTSLVQFYLGEGMYDKAVQFVDGAIKSIPGNTGSPFLQMKVQALIAENKIAEAQSLYGLTKPSGLEGLATMLSMAWATNSMTLSLKMNLNNVLQQATTNPNFDTWSHMLPVLRKLHRIAKQYNAAETQAIYDAIQKIDAGHPL